jgi:NADH-quinone oxidoreductase subunit K
MIVEQTQFFWLSLAFSVLLLFAGYYCILLTYNMVRVLIGLDLLMKGVTLAIISAGYLSGQLALAQGMAITVIVLEVVVMIVAAGVVVGFQRQFDSVNVKNARSLKG